MTFVAPRNVNNISYVTRIKHVSLFAWHAKYLVKFDEFQASLFGAGAALGDVQV